MKTAAEFSESVQADVDESVRIIEWLPLILEIILNLPCLANKSAPEILDWFEDYPNLAQLWVSSTIRRKVRPKVGRNDSVELSTVILSHVAMLPVDDFTAIVSDVRSLPQ